ncbi:tetratricopeptide repeat protein [Amycolatopsis kentuckyensis]|uniref:tetratricopeptide repeat protein n=1 Tax=Amycolatopsis kentuckyensis TaxID=218823 RepID=UPI0011787F03|nr:tetratricopeptide repeat protein [Amycolatopsis kentuckyensis]
MAYAHFGHIDRREEPAGCRETAEQGDIEAMVCVARWLAKHDRLENAASWYRRAAQGGAPVHEELALRLVDGDRCEQAVDSLAETLGRPAAMMWVANRLAIDKRRAEGMQWLRRAAATGDDAAMARLATWLERDRPEEAETWYLKALHTENFQALCELGRLLTRQNRLDEAERLYRRAAGVNPKGLLELADFYDRQGREPDAERCYRQAAESGERSSYIRLGLWLLDHQRSRQETCPWLRKAAEIGYNGFYSKLEAQASRLARAGEGEEALRWFVDSGALIDDFRRGGMAEEAAALQRIARLHDKDGHAEAEAWYRRLAEADPAVGPVALGDWLARHGRVEQALHQYKKAVEAGAAWANMSLAEVLPDEAEHWYRQAADAGVAAAFEPLGELLLRQGRLVEADAWFAKADDLPKGPRAPVPSWEVVAGAAVLSAAVVPFVKALATKAADDTYDAVRNLLRRIARRRLRSPAPDQLLVVEDPAVPLTLHIRTQATDEALRALADLDLAAANARRRGKKRVERQVIAYDPQTKSWRIRD